MRSASIVAIIALCSAASSASAGSYLLPGAQEPVAGSYVLSGPGGVVFGFGPDLGRIRYTAGGVPCRYPNGWNAGDATQSFRGVPVDAQHRCRVRNGVVIDSDGDPTE